jgi:hypothetical protein
MHGFLVYKFKIYHSNKSWFSATCCSYNSWLFNFNCGLLTCAKIIPSISSTIDNSSNSSNNTQQIIEEEFGEDVQKNQQSTVLEQQQLQQPQALPSVKITSHTQNQEVPAGTLTIKGISSDTPSEWQY